MLRLLRELLDAYRAKYAMAFGAESLRPKRRYKYVRYISGPAVDQRAGETISVLPEHGWGATLILRSRLGIFFVRPA